MIELRILSESEIAPYFEDLWRTYRAELISAGFTEGYAEENIENTKKSVFSGGALNSGNYIFYAFAGKDRVGKLWLTCTESKVNKGKKEWSIYDIETFPEYQKKGFGRQIMLAAEEYVKSLGGDSISLSVFGNNLPAQKLYESLNYETVRLMLKKRLD